MKYLQKIQTMPIPVYNMAKFINRSGEIGTYYNYGNSAYASGLGSIGTNSLAFANSSSNDSDLGIEIHDFNGVNVRQRPVATTPTVGTVIKSLSIPELVVLTRKINVEEYPNVSNRMLNECGLSLMFSTNTADNDPKCSVFAVIKTGSPESGAANVARFVTEIVSTDRYNYDNYIFDIYVDLTPWLQDIFESGSWVQIGQFGSNYIKIKGTRSVIKSTSETQSFAYSFQIIIHPTGTLPSTDQTYLTGSFPASKRKSSCLSGPYCGESMDIEDIISLSSQAQSAVATINSLNITNLVSI